MAGANAFLKKVNSRCKKSKFCLDRRGKGLASGGEMRIPWKEVTNSQVLHEKENPEKQNRKGKHLVLQEWLNSHIPVVLQCPCFQRGKDP